MKILAKALFLIYFLTSIGLFSQQDEVKIEKKIQIAVLKFKLNSQDQKFDFLCEQIPSLIESRLKKESQIEIQERRNIKNILKEIELDQLGLLNEKKSVDIAKMTQSDILISGEINIDKNEVEVLYRVVDVHNGKLIFTGNIDKTHSSELMLSIEKTTHMAITSILKKRTSKLSVNTTPNGSKIFIDSNYIGNSPIIDFHVSSEKHTIKAYHDDYLSDEKEINLIEKNYEEVKFNLAYKGFAIFKNRFINMSSFHHRNIDLWAQYFYESMNFNSYQFRYEYLQYPFLIGSYIDFKWDSKRFNELNIFNQIYKEERVLTQFFWGLKLGYVFLINPHYLSIIPSLSIAYRSFSETLKFEEKSNPPYLVEHSLFQPIFHLALDFFPQYRFGIILEMDVIINNRVQSYNGEFNPIGVKKFNEISLSTSEISLQVGFRISFDSINWDYWKVYE